MGNWLRDFETLRGVIQLLQDRPEIQFHVVTLPHNQRYFEDLPNVRFFSGIPLEQYLGLLHGASLFVVPMKSCTSNLAVLEAMACGLPIVTNDVGGIRDYVTEEFAVLLPRGDARGMADSVVGLLEDVTGRRERSRRARAHAFQFAWPHVAERMAAVYRALRG